MNMVMGYVKEMLLYMVISLPFIMVSRLVLKKLRERKGVGINLFHETGVVFFLLFLIGIASQTISPNFGFQLDEITIKGNINAVPVMGMVEMMRYGIESQDTTHAIVNIIGNICMFVPIGLFLPLLWRKCASIKRTTFIGFGISCFIEFCQLFLYRSTDIDDIILNTLGAFLGYLLFRAGNHIMHDLTYGYKCRKKNQVLAKQQSPSH